MFKTVMKRFARRKVSVAGAVILLFFLLVALFGPMLCTQDPLAQDLLHKYQQPSAEHLFGTDYLGRDSFTRMVYGVRVSLSISFTGVVTGCMIGVLMHRAAIAAYCMGISYNPFYPLLYRHKSHAYINIGEFAVSAATFEIALRLDPTNWDCWYHLALSYFLLQDYERAEKVYKICYTMSDGDLDVISCTDWLWMTLRRLGKKEEAARLLDRITPDMNPGVVVSYRRRLLM